MFWIKKQFVVLFLFVSVSACQQPLPTNETIALTFYIKKITPTHPDNRDLDQIEITFKEEMHFHEAWSQLLHTVASNYNVCGAAVEPYTLGNIPKEKIESWHTQKTTLRQILHEYPTFPHFAMVVHVHLN